MATVKQVTNPMMAEAAGDAIEDLADNLTGAAASAVGKAGSIAADAAGVAGNGMGENLAVAENVRQRPSQPPPARHMPRSGQSPGPHARAQLSHRYRACHRPSMNSLTGRPRCYWPSSRW